MRWTEAVTAASRTFAAQMRHIFSVSVINALHRIVQCAAHIGVDARQEILQIPAARLQLRRVLLQPERELRMAHGPRQVVRQLRQLRFGAVQFLQLRLVHRLEAVETLALPVRSARASSARLMSAAFTWQ